MRAIELLTWPVRRRLQKAGAAAGVPPVEREQAPTIAERAVSTLESEPSAEWSAAKKIALRFAFVYFVIYSFPSPFASIPGTDKLFAPFNKLGLVIIPWVAKRILHLSQEVSWVRNGSGDRTYNYVQLLCFVAFSIAATLLWSILDRHRKSYDKLFALLRVYVRYVLALTMLGYGFSKVFRLQFPELHTSRLIQTYGDSSPMGLLWNFMGYSGPYTIFSGLAEAVGGMLLFFRRTTSLGALLLIPVIANIVILNFCYDVPVKLYSSNLLLMAIFLAGPDLLRIADVILFNRPTQAVKLSSPLPSRWMEYARWALKLSFIGWILYRDISGDSQRRKEYAAMRQPKTSLFGYYDVEEFVRNQVIVPAATAQPKRWKRVGINNDMFSVRLMDKSLEQYKMEHDPTKKTLSLASGDKKFILALEEPDADHLILNGNLNGDSMRVQFRKVDASNSLLTTRGFHWINEVPYNR